MLFPFFGSRVYPLGSIVIALVRLSVRQSVSKYLGDRSLVFSETLHEVGGQLNKKSDTAEILRVFGHFLGNRSLKVSNFLHDGKEQ